MKKGIIILVLVALALVAIFYIDNKENNSEKTEAVPEAAVGAFNNLPVMQVQASSLYEEFLV